jgi:hypothetical protein
MRMQRLVALWQQIRGWISRQLSWIDYALSFFRNPHQLVRAWPGGEIPLGPKVAVFVHFDANGRVGDHVLHYVTALRDAGVSVVFVTNSGKLQDASFAALQPVCAGILIRRNVGYDFGAMREGLEHLKLPRDNTEMALVINDSVYGPLQKLDALLARINFNRADLWGATESWQTRYHLQSYFVAAGRKALSSPAWKAFWSGVRPVRSKTWVVNKYEVGLTQKLMRGGITCAAIWPYAEMVDRVDPYSLVESPKDKPVSIDPVLNMRRIQAQRIRHYAVTGRPLNPTSDLWRQLLECGFPFVKRELLRDNPSFVADVGEWRAVAMRVYGDIPAAIDHDLHRVMRNRAP